MRERPFVKSNTLFPFQKKKYVRGLLRDYYLRCMGKYGYFEGIPDIFFKLKKYVLLTVHYSDFFCGRRNVY
jgi:hypothetical protein